MTREDLKKKLMETENKCSGAASLGHIAIGGLCTITGGAALALANTPIKRIIGVASFVWGVACISTGGFYLGKSSTLEDLIKEMPEEKETKNEE